MKGVNADGMMHSGAYSNHYRGIDRQHVEQLKHVNQISRPDSIAKAKRLSHETNKRRRALASKRKVEAQKEERRRQQILLKRREIQQEATERFQRSHIPYSRPPSGTLSTRSVPGLDDALQAIRGSKPKRQSSAGTLSRYSDNESAYHNIYSSRHDALNRPYINKYSNYRAPSPSERAQELAREAKERSELHTRNITSSRTQFEQQLRHHQQLLLEQQHTSLREFNDAIQQEIEEDMKLQGVEEELESDIPRSSSLDSLDSLENHDGSTPRNETPVNDVDSSGDHSQIIEDLPNGMYESAEDKLDSMRNEYINNNNIDHIQGRALHSGPGLATTAQHDLESNPNTGKQQQAGPSPATGKQQQAGLSPATGKQQEAGSSPATGKQQQAGPSPSTGKQQQAGPSPATGKQQVAGPSPATGSQVDSGSGIVPSPAYGYQHTSGSSYQYKPVSAPQNNKKEPGFYMTHYMEPANSSVNTLNKDTNASAIVTDTRGKLQNGLGSGTKDNTENIIKTQRGGAVKDVIVTLNRSKSISVDDLSTTSNLMKPFSGSHVKQWVGAPAVPEGNHHSAVSRASPSDSNILSRTHHEDDDRASLGGNRLRAWPTPSPVGDQADEQRSVNHPAVTNTKPYSARTTSTAMTATTTYNNQQLEPTNNAVKGQTTDKTSITHKVSGLPSATTKEDKSNTTYKTLETASVTQKTTSVTIKNDIKSNRRLTYSIGNDASALSKVTSMPAITKPAKQEEKGSASEVKGILKAPNLNIGIMRKSNSTGSLPRGFDIRDSLEITRANLKQQAQERQTRVRKKSVRFADLHYEEAVEEDAGSDSVEDAIEEAIHRASSNAKNSFHKSSIVNHKPPRPMSAKFSTGTNRIGSAAKPPRVGSAVGNRVIQQPQQMKVIVRPQAAAHIIMNGNTMATEKTVNMLNNNFMEKVVLAKPPVQTVSMGTLYAVPSASNPSTDGTHGTQNTATNSMAGNNNLITTPTQSVSGNGTQARDTAQPVSGYTNGTLARDTGSRRYPSDTMYDQNGLRLDRTPTDDEINWLWDRVRTCLDNPTTGTLDHQNSVSTLSEQSSTGRQAVQMSQKMFDGNSLGRHGSLSRVASNGSIPSMSTPSALQPPRSNTDLSNGYTKRLNLLQQRRQQNSGVTYSKTGAKQNTVYHRPEITSEYRAPTISTQMPQSRDNNEIVSESMAGFLAAEQLSGQSVSESRIQQAIDEAQVQQQLLNTRNSASKVPSALSLEEKRLMESLDRLNEKLQTNESRYLDRTRNQNIQVQYAHPSLDDTESESGGAFRGHQPLISHQRRLSDNISGSTIHSGAVSNARTNAGHHAHL